VTPEEIVRAVFDRVHASNPTVSDLYAEDAVRYGHDGQVQHGRAAIAEFYESRFPTAPPYPELAGMFVQLPYVAVLLRFPEHDTSLGGVIDLFEVDDGAIRSLRVLLERRDTS
jgi:hypothetical protein